MRLLTICSRTIPMMLVQVLNYIHLMKKHLDLIHMLVNSLD